MSEGRVIEGHACPFLRPTSASRPRAFAIAVYCRLPSGRVRIPARDELTRFCISRHGEGCPVYRRARRWEGPAARLA